MRSFVVLAGFIGIAALAAPAVADVNKSLRQPAFTATPAELLKAAATATGDWPVAILRHENKITIDDQGRSIVRWRLVFVVRTQAGVDEWGAVSRTWSPFYQDTPVVRARVIEPGGKVTELDQKLISDAPIIETSPTVYSDRRRLKAPLPRLQVGSVVEEEIVTTDRVPLLAAGTVDTFDVGYWIPIESDLFEVTAPASRKVRVVGRALPAGFKPRHTVAGGRETWTYEMGRLAALPDEEPFTPSDVIQQPYIGISTAGSWNAVARDYRKLVDKRIGDGPFQLPKELPRTPTIETVREIVAWLHRQVRYTGIEFGDASNIPWPPAETVKRGFGDCKDKATLLVALLREAGIRADLALLLTGPELDVDRDLPGMGRFDHAIVRAQVAGRDVWIDATEDLTVVGALPTRDRGRRVLIVADDSRDLVTTPSSVATDTVVRQVRTFTLPEMGAGDVTEVSHEGGSLDAGKRSWIRDERPSEVRKDLESYVDTEYGGTLVDYKTTPPGALGTPFELTVRAKDVQRAYTSRDQIDVYLYPGDTLEKLPGILTTVDDKVVRKHDLELWRPHTFEIENRLILPEGFSPPSVNPERVRTIGGMTLTERQRVDGNTVTFTYTLVTGKARISPKDLKEVQAALQDLEKEEAHIVIEHTGWSLMNHGKPREALEAVKRLIALHPKEALHHTQLAVLLLKAGAGPAARAEARIAVSLEPKSADAHVVLAWVLRRDTLGRDYGFDHDRDGAIKALRKARELDPDHLGAAVELAQMLERDDFDVKGAVAAWRAAYKHTASKEHALGLLRALLRSGDAAEAEKQARALASVEGSEPLLIAAISVGRGSAAAISEAGRMRTGSSRAALINSAATELLMQRQYVLVRELMQNTGKLKAGTPEALLIGGLTRQRAKPGSTNDPRELLASYIFEIITNPSTWSVYLDEQTRVESSGLPAGAMDQLTKLKAMGNDFIWDMSTAFLNRQNVEGKGPWRIEAEILGQRMVVYGARDRGAVKLIGEPTTRPAGIGRHALRMLANKDEAGARQLVDWLLRDGNANTLPFENLRRVWGPTLPKDKGALGVAAAVIAGGGEPGIAIPILEKCSTAAPEARKTCDEVLTLAYIDDGRWSELVDHVATRVKRETTVKNAQHLRAYSFVHLKRFDEADKLIAEVLASEPDDVQIRHARAELAIARGQNDEAVRIYSELAKRPRNSGGTKNNLAWLQAALGKDLPAALILAREAAAESPDSPMVANTLAAVLIELDDLGTARTEAWKAMAYGRRPRPASEDWFVIGRLYEALGLRADAIGTYKKVSKPKFMSIVPDSYQLAQRRLVKLGVKAP